MINVIFDYLKKKDFPKNQKPPPDLQRAGDEEVDGTKNLVVAKTR